MDSNADLTTQIYQNAQSIASLTTNVTLLAEDFKREKETRKEVQETVKAVLSAVQNLSEKMSEISNIKDKVVDVLSSQSGLRHDINNVQNALQGLPILGDKINVNGTEIAKLSERVKSLENRNIKQDGAAGAIRLITHVFWAIFGAAISGLIVYHFFGGTTETMTKTISHG